MFLQGSRGRKTPTRTAEGAADHAEVTFRLENLEQVQNRQQEEPMDSQQGEIPTLTFT